MTLVELLVVIVIIMVLIGLLMPALAAVRERTNRALAAERIAQLHFAIQNYAGEDRRHRYPPQTSATDFTLRYDPAGVAPGNINVLLQAKHKVDLNDFDRTGAAPYAALDPWGRPYQYRVDSDLITFTTPQRPLPLEAWNTEGTRPWGYLWSTGPKGTTNGDGWIYQKDNR
jgi:type II secretory pathway pseudopilin PulG